MYLQDLGSGSYTEFEHDDVAGHIMDNEHLMEYRVGLIHSHHTMAAFFSGTDTEELHEKAEDGLYLSLIVNNHMEPVCKLAWMGQVERKIETFNSWSLGNFIRKPKKVTKTEIANVFYEVQMEINWHESITTIADRYEELEEEEKIVSMGKSLQSGYAGERSAVQGDMFGLNKNSNPLPTPAEKAGGVTFVQKLIQAGTIQSCMGAVLTQQPKTGLGVIGGMTEAMNIIKTNVQSMDDKNDLKGQAFMDAYKDEATNYAETLVEGGDDILAEKLGEFYLDDEDYHNFLTYLYKALEDQGETIFSKEMMSAILEKVLEDEPELDDDAKMAALDVISEEDELTGKDLTDARIEDQMKENEMEGIHNRFHL